LRFLIVECPASSTCPHPAPERPPRTRCLSSVGAVEWQPGALWAQCIPILGACRGAPRPKPRISFLYYFGSFAVWRGVEYGVVHVISACTGRVRRQFEICGYRRQYSKSACAPRCRRCSAALTRYTFTDGRTGNELGSLMLLRAGKREV